MKAALAVATMYPARPSKPLPSSPSIDTLRTVLATTAWVLDYAAEYGKRVEGLVDHHPLLVRPVNCYDWSGDTSSCCSRRSSTWSRSKASG